MPRARNLRGISGYLVAPRMQTVLTTVVHAATTAFESIAPAQHLRHEEASEVRGAAIAPWQTLSEQFSILEDELRARIFKIAQESNFSEAIAQRHTAFRMGNIMPGCGPMAGAALEADAELCELRYRLVPARISEEAFWRCYFWHVSNVKLELLHDWTTANRARRAAVLEDDAILASDTPVRGVAAADDAAAGQPQHHVGGATAFPADELDAEFERLVGSPCRG